MKISHELFLASIAESRVLLTKFKEAADEPLAAAICGCAMIVGFCEAYDVALETFIDFMHARDPEAFALSLGAKGAGN